MMSTEPQKKGRMKWVPANVLNEINNVKAQDRIQRDAEAFDRLVNYSQAGREVNKLGSMFGIPIVKKKRGQDGSS